MIELYSIFLFSKSFIVLDAVKLSGDDIRWSLVPSGFPSCQSIDITKYSTFRNFDIVSARIIFKKQQNYGVYMAIEDKEKSLQKRSLRSQTLEYDGSRIEIDDLSSGMYKRLFLKLELTLNLDSDSGINCKNYPYDNFLSFRECDENYVYKKVKNNYKIMPFWAAKTLSEVSNNR